MLAADPQDVRRTALALAAAELAPPGVIIVDHGDAVAYLLGGGWWVTVRLPERTRDLIAAFYGGRTTVRPVTFGLLVPEAGDLHGAETTAVAA